MQVCIQPYKNAICAHTTVNTMRAHKQPYKNNACTKTHALPYKSYLLNYDVHLVVGVCLCM